MSMWQIAWRNLMRRKLRSILTMLSIVIGVGSAMAVIASVDSAKEAFPVYLKQAFGKADYAIFGTDAYYPEDVYKATGAIDHTASIGLVKKSTNLLLAQDGITAIQKRVEISGFSDMDTPLTNFKVISGSLSGGGAIITDRTAKVWKAGVGDTIRFDTDNGIREIPITAVVKYTVELMGPSSWMMAKYHPWSVAMPLETVQEWFGLQGKVQSVQFKAEGGLELAALEEQLDEFVKGRGNIYAQPVIVDYELLMKDTDTFFMALYIAGLLGIVLSAIIIFNTMYMSIKERTNEFAALKTIGYTGLQLQSLVMIEVLLLTIIGTGVGLMFGYLLATGLKTLIFMIFGVYDAEGIKLARGFIVAVLAGLIVPVIASWLPIRAAGQVSVITALKGGIKVRPGRRLWPIVLGLPLIASAFFIKSLLLVLPLLAGVILIYPYLFRAFITVASPIYSRLFRFSGTVASRNLKRKMGRSASTSVILCLGIALVVLMSSLNSALLQTYEKVIFSSYGGNLDIMFHHVEKDDLAKLRAIEGVADAQTYPLFPAVWHKDSSRRNLQVYGVGAEWIDRFPLFATEEGQSPGNLIRNLGDNEIVLDRISFGVWGGTIGDPISLETLDGPQNFKVVGVVSTMKNNGYGAFMRQDAFGDNFGLKYERNALVLKDDQITPVELRERIFDQFGARIEMMFGPEDWVSVMGATYTGSFAMINMLVILSIIISGVGITNTLLINIMERVREFAMMRATGTTRGQILRMVLLEGFGIGFAGTIIGMVVGMVLLFITTSFIEINSLSFKFQVPGNVNAIIIAFGMAVSLGSSYSPASRASKTHLSEALRYE